jgi:hypothetical protein
LCAFVGALLARLFLDERSLDEAFVQEGSDPLGSRCSNTDEETQ